jgi:Tfp pilus assembly protein PilX
MTIFRPMAASRCQGGFVLVLAILLLLLLIIVTLAVLNLPMIQTRISANTANAQVAFVTGEGTLRSAEGRLLSGTFASFASNASGLYTFDPTLAPVWTTVDWTTDAVLTSPFSGGSAQAGQFLIEELPSVTLPGQSTAVHQYGSAAPTARVFRITARAVGANGKAPEIVQSIFHE